MGVELTRANLSRANLHRSLLTGANFYRADLSRADLTRTNLTGARYNRFTVWPDCFDPVAAGAILVNEYQVVKLA